MGRSGRRQSPGMLGSTAIIIALLAGLAPAIAADLVGRVRITDGAGRIGADCSLRVPGQNRLRKWSQVNGNL